MVVDDWDMAITHVIRGEDHINNTPRQINILKALNAPVPVYAHVSMINGDDGKKLSKRHGAVSVMQYRDDGYLPEALLNYLVRLGWSHGDQEIFTREEMIEFFSLGAVSKSASAFNTDELEVGMGKVGMPLRVAVTGAGQSPALDVTVHAIGKSRSVDRINKALAFIAEREGQAS